MDKIKNTLVIVRGGGDIASGIIQKLYRVGFKILILEVNTPSSIRRKVCFSEAIYDGNAVVEDIKSTFCKSEEEIKKAWEEDIIPVVIDTKGEYIKKLKPQIIVDAILAKKNIGTTIDMAPLVIGVGPGFYATKDCDLVVETMRGHNLGQIIFQGSALKNTGVPGKIKGYDKERVIYSENSGKIKNIKEIGDIVKKGDVIAQIGENKVLATIDGVLRGLIRDGYEVSEKFKIADIDPRIEEQKNCFTISDKARAIGGAVLEGIFIRRDLWS